MFLDFRMILFLAPAMLLAFVAQMMVKSAYSKASQIPARMSGFAAARQMLDSAGLQQVGVEQVPGRLSDHYDPRQKVLRLSQDVYHGRTMAAVGIAAHEAGHAIQDAKHYAPLVVRNIAVPAANFGSGIGVYAAMFGLAMGFNELLLAGIVIFSGVVFFQIVNLPVEFNASTRAKRHLVEHGIINQDELRWVTKVLNAAALTYVAGTLQAILTLLYFVLRYVGRRD
jgi:Zn-dependent membrane protease YugP